MSDSTSIDNLQNRIQAVLKADSQDFFELAELMGRNPLKDYAGANLEGVNLEGKDLSGADFSRTNLRGANLKNSKLSGATLIGADLTGANLEGADFSDVTIDQATLIDHAGVLPDANLSPFPLPRRRRTVRGGSPTGILDYLASSPVETGRKKLVIYSQRDFQKPRGFGVPQSLGVVEAAIVPHHTGKVSYMGTSWLARCPTNIAIQEGTKVVVNRRMGNTLIVSPAEGYSNDVSGHKLAGKVFQVFYSQS
ncbi:pentapeptide repeat-containing protein [Nodosilinea sp. LEGE 07298]|uniref:pentapeptide repeat-containing protein n=1 Tax=Nodosilinea sp. LEGE 07298 TaxID=2777970 RepID=UPI00187E94E3|nr:pentapeptide repeat-containing protein [Nodosilinea sp. LEGE 07298]MBE9109304.1 pentapeptide repeat-containing protein [Nodosilinea sp. LEGE 07298]